MRQGGPDDRWDFTRGRYNRLYGLESQTIYVTTPSDFLLECLENFKPEKPGAALDLGAGQGRNSLALADAGYDVTAVDLSAVGLERLREQAAARGLRVRTVEGDVNAAEFADGAFQVVLAAYFPVSAELLVRLQRSVAPGGVIIIEGYPGDAEPGGEPLPRRFPGWQVLRYETGPVPPDWWWQGEKREAPVVRFMVRRPSE